MKKIITIILIVSVCLVAMAACSPKEQKYKGTDSVENLVNIVMDYIKSSGDYSVIEGVVHPQACLAYFLKEESEEHSAEKISWNIAMEKANLIMQGVDKLQKDDPVLAREILEMMQHLGKPDIVELNDAIEILCKYVRFERENAGISRYKDLKGDFSSDNIESGDGCNRYDMGSVLDDNSSWRLTLVYYFENGLYYLISFDETVGGIGG